MPRKPQALTGTPAAAQLCGCGHSRLRHCDHGTGECAAVERGTRNPNRPYLTGYAKRCTCPAFTDPKGN